MASRTGTRAQGTDGSDYMSRETIPMHFRLSYLNKNRVKFLSYMHLLLYCLMLLRAVPDIADHFAVKATFVDEIRQFTPATRHWEFGWLLSIIPTLMAFVALPRNRSFILRGSLLFMLPFSVAPVLRGVWDESFDMMDWYYVGTDKVERQIMGFPYCAICYGFLTLCAQIHGFTAYFCWQLLKNWSASIKYAKQKKSS